MQYICIILIKEILYTGGIDYDPGPYNITIPGGVTNLLFNVPLAIDDIVELEEEFELTIDGASLPAMVIGAEPTRVIIVDNDSKLIRI